MKMLRQKDAGERDVLFGTPPVKTSGTLTGNGFKVAQCNGDDTRDGTLRQDVVKT